MSEALILNLGHTPDDPVRWAVMSGGNVVHAGAAASAHDLSECVTAAQTAQTVVAVLPGEQAAMRAIPAPPRAAAKFRAAAAYLLEDDLAENLDNLHVATTRHASGAGLAVAIKKSVMEMWRDVFAENGFTPDILTPDFALLPLQTNGAVMIIGVARIIGAVGLQGFAAERPLADSLLSSLVAGDAVEGVTVYGVPGSRNLDFGGKPVDWRELTKDAVLLALFEDAAVNGNPPNLLQGDYRRRRDWRGALGPWRRAAVLAAACLVGVIGVSVADAARSERLAARLNQETVALHKSAFPDQADRDPREYARSVLGSGPGGPSFLAMSAKFADSLAESDKFQVDRIRFNAARNEYSINLRFSDINDLETLKRSLSEKGVNATEAGGVRRSGGFYVGELRVGEP